MGKALVEGRGESFGCTAAAPELVEEIKIRKNELFILYEVS